MFFVDDNLIGNKKAAKLLMPKLVEWQRRTGYRLRLIGECTLNLAQDRELLGLMREAYFTTSSSASRAPTPMPWWRWTSTRTCGCRWARPSRSSTRTALVCMRV